MTACPACGHDPCLGAQSTITAGERCVLAHHREPCRPRRAVSGLYLCGGHRRGLGVDLAELPAMHDVLPERHTAKSGGIGERSGGGHAGLSLNGKVADCRSGIYYSLAGWAKDMAERRDWTLPADDIVSIGSFVLGRDDANLDWWCSHPAVDEVFKEIDQLHRDAFGLLYPRGRRRFEVGDCIEVTSCDVATQAEQRCPGRMLATITDQDDELPSAMYCDCCGLEITADRWITYGRRVHKAMGMTA